MAAPGEPLQVRERLAPADAPATRAGAAVLRAGYELRVKSRFVATLADGRAVGVVLARGAALRDGDWLRAEDGTPVVVEAAPQPVLCITAAAPLELLRVVYHLANRHVPAQIAADYVLIEPDPVLAHMARHLGAEVEQALLPFDPEPGAYEGHAHPHGHGPAHGHGEEFDVVAASVGEQLSVEAHRARLERLEDESKPR